MMKLKALQEFWILNTEGKKIYHNCSNKADEKHSSLLEKFLAGILKFMSEMGGNEIYHIEIAESTIIGLKFNDNPKECLNSWFIVGAFNGKRSNRYIKQMKNLREEISAAGFDCSCPEKCLSALNKFFS